MAATHKVFDQINENEIHYDSFTFSGGEIQVKVRTGLAWVSQDLRIEARLHSPNALIELMLLVDAIRRAKPGVSLSLICPYLPYARQDRVMNYGEALSLRVACDVINSLKFSSVEIWDVHSDVALALLDNVTNVHQKTFVTQAIQRIGHCILVAPDAGAMKKVHEVAKHVSLPFVRADKVRDVTTGNITGTKVYSPPVGNQNFLIVDDICDGGRTFIELARALRVLTDGSVYLYVTHGIFSQGLSVFDGVIDAIYTANIFDPSHEGGMVRVVR